MFSEMEDSMGKMKSLLSSMLKVGVIGFGGGNALIPVIEQEVVQEKKLISKEEYDRDIIAATLTPGALPVEIASGVGLQTCGKRGMLAGGIAMALPGSMATVLLMSVLRRLDSGILNQIQYASIGVTAFIMCLLTQYILDTLRTYRTSRFRVFLWFVMAGVFVVTGGATVLKIFRVTGIPVIKLSTIDVLLVTILGSIVYSLIWKRPGKKKKKIKKLDMKPIVGRTAIWLVFLLVMSLPAVFFVSYHAVTFDLHGLASSLLSFGGGDAYLTIADGLFVPDFIEENEFYSHLVLLVNVLPGSILCKTLSGIGYAYGEGVSGSMWGGFAVSLAGFVCSVAASCAIFHIIYYAYEWLEKINIFIILKKVIRVIVSGLLMTVMAGLIKSGIDMNSNPSLPWYTVLVMIFALYGLNMLLFHKGKCKNITLILISLVLSMGACNLIGL